MFLYHPALDGYHAAFRMLRILTVSKGRALEYDAIRILDFYLLFPELIAQIRLPRKLHYAKHRFGSLDNKYHFRGAPRLTFAQMAPLQDMALRLLVSKRLLELQPLTDGLVLRSSQPLPTDVETLIHARNAMDAKVIEFFVNDLMVMPLHGEDGLKARCSLMEYRYDA